MITVGIVKSVDRETATVLVEAEGGCCDRCEKEACDIGSSGVETEALNPVHARVGQKVALSMKTFTYVKGAMVLFIMPVFALLLGAFLGEVYLPSYIHGFRTEALSAAGGFIMFGLALVLAKILSARMGRRTEHKTVIESVIEG